MIHIFLTGATGYLGKDLLKQLLTSDSCLLTLLVRKSVHLTAEDRIQEIIEPLDLTYEQRQRVSVVEGDLNSLCDLDFDLPSNGKSYFIHSAAALKTGLSEEQMYETNFNGVKNVVSFCNKNKFSRLIHISTAYCCGEGSKDNSQARVVANDQFSYFRPNNRYEDTKQMGEQYIKNHCLSPFTIVRPTILVDSYDIASDLGNPDIPAIGIYGWFQLVESAHRIAVKNNEKALSIAGYFDASLDLIEVSKVGAKVVDLVAKYSNLKVEPSTETLLLSGGRVIKFYNLIQIARENYGLHKLRLFDRNSEDFTGSGESLYKKYGQFFIDYCTQYISFQPTMSEDCTFPSPVVVRDQSTLLDDGEVA